MDAIIAVILISFGILIITAIITAINPWVGLFMPIILIILPTTISSIKSKREKKLEELMKNWAPVKRNAYKIKAKKLYIPVVTFDMYDPQKFQTVKVSSYSLRDKYWYDPLVRVSAFLLEHSNLPHYHAAYLWNFYMSLLKTYRLRLTLRDLKRLMVMEEKNYKEVKS